MAGPDIHYYAGRARHLLDNEVTEMIEKLTVECVVLTRDTDDPVYQSTAVHIRSQLRGLIQAIDELRDLLKETVT